MRYAYAAAVLVLAVAAFLVLRPVARPDPAGGAVRVLRGGAEAELSGPLAMALVPPLEQALARGARTVQLDSAGGPSEAAEALAAAIRAAGADTAITDRCLSACAVVFAAGRRRWAGPFSQMGLEARYEGASLLAAYRRAGLPEADLRGVAATPDGEGWFLPGADLVANGMATGVSTPDQFALAGFGPAPTDESIRARLLAVPLYRAMATASPAAFEVDLVAWRRAVLQGEPGTAAFARTRSTIRGLVGEALADAPLPLLRDHADLLAEEADWIRRTRPDRCGALLRGDPAGFPDDPALAARRAALDLRLMESLPARRDRAAPAPFGPAPAVDCQAVQRHLAAARHEPALLRAPEFRSALVP